MPIGLDDNGNFLVDAQGHLLPSPNPPVQNAKAECRCLQGTWDADPFFGRNALVWGVSQSPVDRSLDLSRIVTKYTTLLAVVYNEENTVYDVQLG